MNKTIKLIVFYLLGFSLTIAISINFFSAQLIAQSSQEIHLIQQGIKLYQYQSEQFEQAIKVWDTALNQEEDQLGKSLILSNLSLVYQNLGQWQEAEKAINSSLEILNNLDITTPTYTEIFAKALNSQGHLQWLQGNLEDRLEVIFKSPKQPLKHHTTYIKKEKIEQSIRELKTAIIRGYASDAIALSQNIYDWLIEPWSEYLEDSNQISTLVFILDGELMTNPQCNLWSVFIKN